MERASGACSPWPGSWCLPIGISRELVLGSWRGSFLLIQNGSSCSSISSLGSGWGGRACAGTLSWEGDVPPPGHHCWEVGQTDGRMGLTVQLSAQHALPPASEPCFPLPSLSCLVSQEVLGERALHVPSVTSPTPGSNVPAVKH